MLKSITAWMGGLGVVITSMGLLMAQIAAGNRGLIGYVGVGICAIIAALVLWTRHQRRGLPSPTDDKARKAAAARSRREVYSLVACFGVATPLLWLAGASQREVDDNVLLITCIGIGAICAAAAVHIFVPDGKK